MEKICHHHKDENGLTIRDCQSSLAQLKSDIGSIHSAILSVFRKSCDCSILDNHEAATDGISAWIDIHAKHENKGATTIVADDKEDLIHEKFHKSFPGGVDVFLT